MSEEQESIDETINTNNTLALKYRPKTFESLVGHKTVLSTLNGVIKSKNLPNAFMITGGSGIGKTTLARLIGRYLNCSKLSSCGKCLSCKSMKQGNIHPDYIEINGSEGGGIDNIRELIEIAQYLPQYRVRIIHIDECHKLTQAAANALLKPLEEPPPKTLWVLATTDPDRIPNNKAVIGRCMVLNLSSPSKQEITENIQWVGKKEKFEWVSKKVANYIAEAANGQVRDSLQLLEAISKHISGLKTLPKNEKEYAKIVSSLSLTISSTDSDKEGLRLLFGLYTKDAKSVQKSILDAKDHVGLLTRALNINYYIIGKTLVGKHENLWETRVNLTLRSALQGENINLQKGLLPVKIHKVLTETREKLVTVQINGEHICTAMLTGFIFNKKKTTD